MKKTKNKRIILKRIKKTLVLLTIANYLAFINMLILFCRSGIAAKILDFIFVIY